VFRFPGVYANLLTALSRDARTFDAAAQRDYVDRVVGQKVHGVSTSLSSGEFGYQTGEERASVIDCVCRAVNGRVPVLAGVSELTLEATCDLARRAQDSGASAVMAMPRSYFVLNETEVLHYFERVLEAVALPIGIYNNPSATGIDISAELYERIVKLDPARIVVSKDGSGHLFRTPDVLARCKDFSLLQGYAQMMLAALLHGAPGTDFALASLLPRHFVAIYDHVVVRADLAQAKEAYARLLPLFRLMEKYNVTRLAKAVAPMVGLDLGPHREPLLPLPPEQTAEIRRVIDALGPH
jgi:4-hydroxy-tetrahydrodipicolinate synthase